MTRKQEKFYRKYFELGMGENAALKALEIVFSIKTWSPKQKKDKINYLLSRNDGITLLESLKEKAPFSPKKTLRPKEKPTKTTLKKGKKIALKGGEFETLFFKNLTDEEKALLNITDTGRETQIKYELKLITIRENRMLERISKYNNIAEELLIVYQESGNEGKMEIFKERREAAIKTIISIEDALTRVQQSKVKFIRELARLEESKTDEEEQKTALDRLIEAQDKALNQ